MPRYYEGSTGKTDIVIPWPKCSRTTNVMGIPVKTGCGFGQCPDRYLYLSHPEILDRVFHRADYE
jgi:hypothetical protein